MSDPALYLMAGAVLVSSVSLAIIAVAAMRIYGEVRKLQQEVSPLIPQAMQTLEQARVSMAETAADMRELTEKTRELLEAAHRQVQSIEAARVEFSEQFRVQAERVELVAEDILSRVQEVVGVVHNTVLRPVREVSGLFSGVKAAVQSLILGRRPTVDRATHDDEMFI